MAEEYLLKVSADTRRGLRGRAKGGLCAGGRPYGYRTEPAAGGFRLVVDEDEAAIVRRIFEWSAAGEGLRVIAHRLNAEGIPAPRPRSMTGYDVKRGLELSNVGAKVLSVIGEEYLVTLRADTQRGLLGCAERGLSTGGLAYGYRSDPVALDEHGRPVESAGFRVVVEEVEAAVVRRILDLYLGGAGLREIAHQLKAEGVVPPRPRALKAKRASWAPTSIREMLRNPLYAGELKRASPRRGDYLRIERLPDEFGRGVFRIDRMDPTP